VRLAFLSPRHGNVVLHELFEDVAAAVRDAGVEAIALRDGTVPPDDPDTVTLVAPHEWFVIDRGALRLDDERRRRTIGFCTEHPGTAWYEESVKTLPHLGAAVEINKMAVRESRRRGQPAEYFQLGWHPGLDLWGGDTTRERDCDILYLACSDPRRDRVLAGYVDELWRHRTRLVTPPSYVREAPEADYMLGRERRLPFLESTLTLNVHRHEASGLQWPRFLEAIANGCVVVSEHVDDASPLVAAQHYVSGDVRSLPFLADWLLGNPEELVAIRDRAYRFVREEVRLADAIPGLLDLAEHTLRVARRPRARPARPDDDLRALWRDTTDPALRPVSELDEVRAWMKTMALEVTDLRRRLAGSAPGVTELHRSPAYDAARPRVSVITPLYRQTGEVADAIASVAVSTWDDVELLILDDGSPDDSVAAALAATRARPWLPALVMRSEGNRGPAATRNELIGRARGELLFFLDSDNRVMPTGIERLVAALDAEPAAAFAYPTMAAIGPAGSPLALVSCRPWNPEWLSTQNYIDMLSLWRADALARLGGLGEDPRIVGVEDWDLWCRAAEHGMHGVHVPELLARYAATGHSLSSSQRIDGRALVARSFMASRAPSVFAAADL
jgi:GT2 family glycosyltransferase